MKKLLLILIPGAILFYLYNRSKLQFKIQGFKFSPFPAVVIRLMNTTPIPAYINSILIDISLNTDVIGSVSNFNQITIPANSKIDTELKIDLNAIGLTALGYRWLQAANRKSINLAFNGTINLDNLAIPVTDNYILK